MTPCLGLPALHPRAMDVLCTEVLPRELVYLGTFLNAMLHMWRISQDYTGTLIT